MARRFGFLAVLTGVLLGSIVCISAVSGQTLLSSFENNLTSSSGADWSEWDTFEYSYTTIGATEGTTALAMAHPTQGNWTIQGVLTGGVALAQQVVDHGFLQVDVTTTDVGEAGDGLSPSWRQVYIIINSNQGGWQQSQYGLTVAPDDGTSLTETLTLDLSSIVSTDPNPQSIQANAAAYVASGGGEGTWFELFIALQGDDVGQIKTGDYNANSAVDAADFGAWRTLENSSEVLTNETVSPGLIDQEDYDEWKANFGAAYKVTTIFDNFRFANAGSGSIGGVGVPEPTSAFLALSFALSCLVLRRGR